MELIADRLPAIRGKIVDCSGAAIPSVRLFLRGSHPENSTYSAVDGSFQFGCVNDWKKYRIEVDEESLPEGLALPWWQSLPTHRHVGDDHFLRGSLGRGPIEITLPSRNELNGVALGTQLDPLGSSTLSFRKKKNGFDYPVGPNYVVQTDASGAFSVQDMSPGTYEVRSFAKNLAFADVYALPVSIEVGCLEEDVTLAFDDGYGSCGFTVAVSDQFKGPLQGLMFGVYPLGGGVTYTNRLFFQARASAVTDQEGVARVHGLAPGDYLLARVQSMVPDAGSLYLDREDFIEVHLNEQSAIAHLDWTIDVTDPAALRCEVLGTPSEGRITLRVECLWQVDDPSPFTMRSLGGSHFSHDALPPGPAEVSVVLLIDNQGQEEERILARRSVDLSPNEEVFLKIEY